MVSRPERVIRVARVLERCRMSLLQLCLYALTLLFQHLGARRDEHSSLQYAQLRRVNDGLELGIDGSFSRTRLHRSRRRRRLSKSQTETGGGVVVVEGGQIHPWRRAIPASVNKDGRTSAPW